MCTARLPYCSDDFCRQGCLESLRFAGLFRLNVLKDCLITDGFFVVTVSGRYASSCGIILNLGLPVTKACEPSISKGESFHLAEVL